MGVLRLLVEWEDEEKEWLCVLWTLLTARQTVGNGTGIESLGAALLIPWIQISYLLTLYAQIQLRFLFFKPPGFL